ncbi:MAG: SAM-dependent methyltransferase, partial [Bacteroidota bacterium]
MNLYQENSLNNTAVNNCKHRELVQTADGSFTLFIPEVEETYHSKHGAVQESMHVFIE